MSKQEFSLPKWLVGKGCQKQWNYEDLLILMELVIGIEPTTCWLQVSCSTVEPHQHMCLLFNLINLFKFKQTNIGASRRNRTTDTKIFSLLLYRLSYRGIIWRPGRDSNPRPLAWQASVLTNWTTRPNFMRGILS